MQLIQSRRYYIYVVCVFFFCSFGQSEHPFSPRHAQVPPTYGKVFHRLCVLDVGVLARELKSLIFMYQLADSDNLSRTIQVSIGTF